MSLERVNSVSHDIGGPKAEGWSKPCTLPASSEILVVSTARGPRCVVNYPGYALQNSAGLGIDTGTEESDGVLGIKEAFSCPSAQLSIKILQCVVPSSISDAV